MNLLLGGAVIVAATAVAIILLLLLRRWSPHGGHFADTTRAAGVFTILATFFAVLFAFVVLFAFGAYDTASSAAAVEAGTVLQQFETAQLIDTEHAGTLSGQLRCYALSVIHQEWPAMRADERLGLNVWDTDLFLTIEEVQPTTPAQQEAYAQWLDQRAVREEARQTRVLGEEGVIPAPVWLGLVVTAGIVWGFVFLFADRGEGTFVQCTIVGSVTAMLVTGLLLVQFLDHPYRSGAGSLEPVAMEDTVAQIDLLVPALGIELPRLCDETGQPLS